ncbi:hypothetical protein EDD11_003223 [Mortierella claussenii]|nr:hypothetical protein EDD11_003223 [Mortierella claussenii]
MSPFRSALRRRMLPWVRGETQTLAALQKRWRTPFLDSYFTLTAFAGHPLFFVCILPIMFWYGHSVFARGFVNVACIGVFVTSWVKDYLCLPRPLSPPLIRLSRSKRVHLEYGFPSTHTSNATSIALYLLSYLLISDWSLPTKLFSIIGLGIYLFSVIFGRLYCGMHTKTDILGGTAIGVLVWGVQWTFHDSIDALMTSPSWKAVIMGIFPASQHFALSSYAVSFGGHHGIVHYDSSIGLAASILRFVFGLAVVFTWRMVAKKLLYIVLPPLYSYFNLPSRTHFVPAKTYGNLRSQPIGRVPSVLDLSALADSSIEIVGPQSTMDIHEQFSQSRFSKRSSVQNRVEYDIGTKEHFGLRPSHANKKKAATEATRQEVEDLKSVTSITRLDAGEDVEKAATLITATTGAGAFALESLDGDGLRTLDKELEESERIAMEKFEEEHPSWARFDVDIVIKTVVYAGIGWLAVDSIPIMFEYIGLGTSQVRS